MAFLNISRLYENKKIIAANPFPTDDGELLHFLFLAATPENPYLAALVV